MIFFLMIFFLTIFFLMILQVLCCQVCTVKQSISTSSDFTRLVSSELQKVSFIIPLQVSSIIIHMSSQMLTKKTRFSKKKQDFSKKKQDFPKKNKTSLSVILSLNFQKKKQII